MSIELPQKCKLSVCAPTHLTIEEAEALAMACFIDDVTKSKYIRRLVIADLAKRKYLAELTTRSSDSTRERNEQSDLGSMITDRKKHINGGW
jgi:hypothetical protein